MLAQMHILYYFDQFVFDSEFLIQLKFKKNRQIEKKLLPQ
jgi:hypothetical protein